MQVSKYDESAPKDISVNQLQDKVDRTKTLVKAMSHKVNIISYSAF